MIHYFWWIPAVIIVYGLMSWLSVKNNVTDEKVWLIPFIIVQILPIWTVVAKVSKRLLFDAMIYDILMFLSINIAIGYFTGMFSKFSILQLIGFLVVVAGFILMRVGGKI